MLTLTRQGVTPTRAQGLVDSLSLSYNGNQLKKVSDQITNAGLAGSMDFKDYADEETEYSFNMNGAMTQDLNKGITSIAYNYLNLPQEMNINASAAEAKTWYTYSATGQKLSVVYKWNSERQITPLTGSNLKAITGTVPDEGNMDKVLTLDYAGNMVYEDNSLKMILLENGYYDNTDKMYYFYITDHLGNNRIVANASGDVVQSNEYYPFGLLMATSTEADKQPYKYGSKELDTNNGLNWYDFEARFLDGMRFTTVDPLAEKYFSWSPYAYVANNPLKFIDPTGMSMDDYYVDKQGEILAQVKTNEEDRIIVNELDEVTVRPQGPIDYYSRGGVTRAYDINTGDDYGIVGETPLKTVSPEFDALLIGRLAFNAASAATRQVAKETAAKTSTTTVGRWMSKAEAAAMRNGSPAAVGAGGKTSVTVGGPNVWNSAKPGSVYVEFQVPTNSLVPGGGKGIYSILGPNASKSQLFQLQKLGGQVSPPVQNISSILKIK